MTSKYTLFFIGLLGLFSLLVPSAIFAAAPSSVAQVNAQEKGGMITVTWTPVDGAVGYHLYYSHQSIILNNGDYDDLVTISGTTPQYVFEKSPLKNGTIFFGVLAVDSTGQESDGFETEATVTIAPPLIVNAVPFSSLSSSALSSSFSSTSQPRTSSSSSSLQSSLSTTQIKMSILSLRPVSSTGILINFNKPILPSYIPTLTNFLILDGSGVILPIVNTIVTGNSLLLKTLPQTPVKTYVLSFGENIPAVDNTQFPSGSAPAQFTGFSGSMTLTSSTASQQLSSSASIVRSSSSSVSSSTTPAPLDVIEEKATLINPSQALLRAPAGLTLEVQNEKNGFFDVLVTWTEDTTVDSFRLLTSLNGESFTEQMQLSPSDTQALLTHIRSETSLSVKLVSIKDGVVSTPSMRSLRLPESGFGSSLLIALALGYSAYAYSQRKWVRSS